MQIPLLMASSGRSGHTEKLESHLRQENPILADIVQSYRRLDRVGRRLGVLNKEDSFADQVSWWPVISVLGTFSAGKSTFLNHYLQRNLQRTGNQAVDDKFTVICYGDDDGAVLPGLAVDSDPRFPFYKISSAIRRAAETERRSVDSYLQLKTCSSERLRGKIIIDSPGFDADKQRSSTLVISDHIIDLSDLVLVFFDARHPEPGAMADTLEHLVSNTVSRPDANKFLYVLNQIDNTAREDNPEEVVAAWQRALAQHGLTAGRFYRIYSPGAAIQIDDYQVRERLERKRDEDLHEIEARIQQVEVERIYRVAGALEQKARLLRDRVVPQLTSARRSWRRRTWWLSLAAFAVLIALLLGFTIGAGLWDGFIFTPLAGSSTPVQVTVLIVAAAAAGYLYLLMRGLAGRSVARKLEKETAPGEEREPLLRAFAHNRRASWQSPGSSRPQGWTRRTRRRLDKVLHDVESFIQSLNDRFATPSGRGESGRST